jgi:hypothetical protein
MSDLIEFLRARLDAEEAEARRLDDEEDLGYESWEIVLTGETNYPFLEFLRITKKRVLAEVDAKRRIVKWCEEVIGDRDLSQYDQFGSLKDDKDALAVTLAVETLRLLALPYADHPDYREEWRP